MRTISIKAGFGGVYDFQNQMERFQTKHNSVMNAFAVVKRKTNNASGGVGNMRSALSNIENRIRAESNRQAALERVAVKTRGFLDLAVRVDGEVARGIKKNREALNRRYPRLRVQDESWVDKILAGLKSISEWLEGAKKSITKFWKKNKEKIILTAIVAVCAVITIVGVAVAGPAVLVPFLTLLGHAGSAAAISALIFKAALVSTVLATGLNIIDIWTEIDNPVFNTVQFLADATSFVTTLGLDIGDITNGILKFSAKELKLLAKMSADDIVGVVAQHRQMRQFPKIVKNLGKTTQEYRVITGNFGEMMQDKLMRIKGYFRTDKAMATKLDAPLRQGIDGVYRSAEKFADGFHFVIGEAKYNKATLNKCSNGLKQMTKEWIESRLTKASPDILDRESMEFLLESALDVSSKRAGKFVERLSDGTLVFKYLDKDGKIITEAADIAKVFLLENELYTSQLTKILPDGAIRFGELDVKARVIGKLADFSMSWTEYIHNIPKSVFTLPSIGRNLKELFAK